MITNYLWHQSNLLKAIYEPFLQFPDAEAFSNDTIYLEAYVNVLPKRLTNGLKPVK